MLFLFPLITFPYSSRVLLPAGIGRVNFAQSIISYFVMIASLGISAYGVREAAKIRDDKKKLSKFVKEIWNINLFSTIFAYILLAVALLFLPRLSEYRSVLCICSAAILFGTLGVEWLYSALEEYRYITIRSIIFNGISVILLFTFVKTSADYLQYSAISVISTAGSNICNFIQSRKYVDWKVHEKLSYRSHLKPILILFSMTLAVNVYTALDSTMLGFITGDKDVGLYTAATKINKMVLSLIISLSAVLLPRLSYYAEKNNATQFDILFEKAINLVLMISIPAVCGLCILCKPILLIFSGTAYLEAVPAMQIMNPIIIAIALSNMFGMQLFMPLRKEILTMYSVIGGAIINFIFNLLLIPKYGVFGAGVSTVIAEVTVTIIQIILARKYIDITKCFHNSWQYVLSALVMTIVIYYIGEFVTNNILKILFCTVSGFILYGGTLLLLKNKFLIYCLNIFVSPKGKI